MCKSTQSTPSSCYVHKGNRNHNYRLKSTMFSCVIWMVTVRISLDSFIFREHLLHPWLVFKMSWLYLRKTTLFLVFILHVSTDTQGHGSQCPVFKVQRGAVHKVRINKPFKISCNLMYCDDQTINVTWTKENKKEWIPVTEADQMSTSQTYSSSDPKMLTSYLTFTNISKHHDGLYRCELKLSDLSTVSHNIKVSVSDDSMEDEMYCTDMTAEREDTDSSSDSYPWWLPYLFICLGVVILVIIVMLILILCINTFKNSRRKNAQRAQVQYTALLKRDEYVCVQYSEETLWPDHDHTSG